MGFRPGKAAAAVAITAAIVTGPAATAATPSRWAHYLDRKTGNVLVVKRACIGAEDSAYHLRTLDYADHGGRVVIGCHHKGY